MAYLKWKEKTITNFSEKNISALYETGFLFGRTGKGEIYQTRSLRIDLSKFTLLSENRRVLKKTEKLILQPEILPYKNYSWTIGKLGKDFYEHKFGSGTFSANKIKEIFTEPKKNNFNLCLAFTVSEEHQPVGFAICYQNTELLHYSYPFYNLSGTIQNLGLGMMTRAILWAQEQNKKYIYLGSFSRPNDTYKLQFSALEWWDKKTWQTNTEKLKKSLLHD